MENYMRYFIIEEDKKVKNLPHILNWMKTIDARNLKWGSYHKLPEISTLYIQKDDFAVFTDILSRPFFMLSKNLQEIIKLYEPNMGYRQVVLIDYKKECAAQYFLPHLQVIDCLTKDTKFNLDHSMIERAVVEQNKIGEKAIFQLGQVSNRYVVVRFDVLESFLRRGALFQFHEIEVV